MSRSRTTAIRLAAMAIESLTASDGGSLQAAQDCVDRLSYELTVLRVAEGRPRPPEHVSAVLARALADLPRPVDTELKGEG